MASQDIEQFIQNTTQTRELKRAIAVQMHQNKIDRKIICKTLQISSAFVSKWIKIYTEKGAESLNLQYKGSKPKLTKEEKEEVINHLKNKNNWKIQEIIQYIKDKYNTVYQSQQSYYCLMNEAGFSWKKTQKNNPKKDEQFVLERREWLKK
uniref:helix-turn-helix domain-containing protein n=1 Tax=Armatimonas sp. TaxID=1872638 RepID=UPI003751ED68